MNPSPSSATFLLTQQTTAVPDHERMTTEEDVAFKGEEEEEEASDIYVSYTTHDASDRFGCAKYFTSGCSTHSRHKELCK